MVKSAYSFATQVEKIEKHIIVVWVDNEAGVLARVIGFFSGRGYNIDSLAVAEIDKKKRAAPAERLLLSKLANKIYQEQFGSFYSPSGIGTGFNPKQYTNLVRQQAAQQGIDMSKFENVIMNGINLSTGEEVKTMREKAGYEYPDKPKMEDLVKGMIGTTSGIYKKDEMSKLTLYHTSFSFDK